MYKRDVPSNFSLAIVEVVPIGGADAKGIKNNPLNAVGLQSSDRYSIPRVLSIIDRNSAEGEILLCNYGTNGSDRFNHLGMLATLTTLRQESHYLAYTEIPGSKRTFYLPKIHGVDDGAFGSPKAEELPSAITGQIPQRELFPEN